MSTEHTGATEDYAAVLASMRAEMAQFSGEWDTHVDGGDCEFEVAVVWRCALCGREQHQPVSSGPSHVPH